MAIKKAFLREAKRMAEDIRNQHNTLQQKEEELTKKLNEIEEKRSNFSQVNTRFKTYPTLDTEDPCPQCWLLDGVARKMRPTGQDEQRNDIFRCSHCDSEIVYKI